MNATVVEGRPEDVAAYTSEDAATGLPPPANVKAYRGLSESDSWGYGFALFGGVLGFGLGHAFLPAPAYREKGWIFTASEATSLGLLIHSTRNCSRSGPDNDRRYNCHDAWPLLWGVSFIGFKIWEILDFFPRLSRWNEENLEAITGESELGWNILPTPEGGLQAVAVYSW
jgi:hypothetical protein